MLVIHWRPVRTSYNPTSNNPDYPFKYELLESVSNTPHLTQCVEPWRKHTVSKCHQITSHTHHLTFLLNYLLCFVHNNMYCMRFLNNEMSISWETGVAQRISRFCHSSLQMNAMSVHKLALTANEKNRHSYRGNGGKGKNGTHCSS